jgi:hypothetical protein
MNQDGRNTTELKRIKKNVENSYMGYKSNYERYTRFRNFVFVTSMNDGQKAVNNELQRPSLEFNVTEAYLSRLIGELAGSELSLKLTSSPDYAPTSLEEKETQAKLIETLVGYSRHIIFEANRKGTQFETLRDTISGGFSSTKLFTDYIDHKSFLQNIGFARTYEQTLVGFDNLARDKDKCDGDYCFEIIPKRKEDFMEEFPDVDITKVKFARQFSMAAGGSSHFGPFNWSYKVGQDEILLVAEYYEKKKKKTKLYRLSDGRNMIREDYKRMVKEWEDSGTIALPPIVLEERDTEVTRIMRHIVIENEILSTEETEFIRLPIKFIDGNSIVSRDDTSGSSYQMTRPYFYHAEGFQKLKNFAGQQLANELENMRPVQVIASLESIPEKYLEGYNYPQTTSTLLYNQFLDGDASKPLNPPVFAPRQPIPAEISATFAYCDEGIMHVLGNFDMNMADLSQNAASGKAIIESLSMGNAGAKPYVENYVLGFQSVLQDIIDMIPIYYATPRSLPIISEDGKHDYVMINQEGGVSMNYEPGAFKLEVSAGVTFEAQQTKFMTQTVALANAIPTFGKFLNDDCLDLVVDNLTIRNVETMKVRAEQWMQRNKQMEQMAMQQAAQQPSMESMAMQVAQSQVQAEHEVGMARVEASMLADKTKTELKAAEIELEREKMRVEVARILAELRIEEEKLGIEQQKTDDKRVDMALNAAVKQSDHLHSVSDAAVMRDLAKAKDEFDREIAKHSKATEAVKKNE